MWNKRMELHSMRLRTFSIFNLFFCFSIQFVQFQLDRTNKLAKSGDNATTDFHYTFIQLLLPYVATENARNDQK